MTPLLDFPGQKLAPEYIDQLLVKKPGALAIYHD